MTLEIIEAAIERHIEWVTRFRAALAGTGDIEFNPELASDDTACALGQWLAKPEMTAMLGMDYFNRTTALHGTFHEIAGAIVVSMQAGDPPEVTQGLIDALADLSKSLIEFLEFARRQLSGAPKDWKV